MRKSIFKNVLALILVICMIMPMISGVLPTVFAATAEHASAIKDRLFSSNNTTDRNISSVGAMVDIEKGLASYKVGATQYLENDGYIGIPVQTSVFYSKSNAAKAGVGGTPIIMYVVNTNTERVGKDSDVSIITSMLDKGYAVVVVDYLNSEKAVSPELDWSLQLVRAKVQNGDLFTDSTLFPKGTYKELFVAPAGHNVSLGHVYWEIDKHSSDGTLEYITEVWNKDFRSVYAERVIKWVDEDGNRKATQNGYDNSSPLWLNADGSENADGKYIRVKHTKAEDVTDCVKPDGSPLDFNLYMNVIYPTNPDSAVPVMSLLSSGDHLASSSAKADRPQLNGFAFSGYAVVMYDYGYVPMARADHYGEFSGSATNAVTGDNVTYSLSFYNDKKINTAAMRYIRYLALSDSETYNFKLDAFGIYGNSKGGWATYLGEEHPELLDEKRFFVGHHGESRYEAGKTETVGIVDGGEPQPWLTYKGESIDSGADLVYSSCGGAEEHITDGHAPTYISCNLGDSTYHGTSNNFVNACRMHDVPTLWFEANVGHTFAYGEDLNYGVDTYSAFFTFCDYYLKGTATKVVYTSYTKVNTEVEVSSRPVVKFSGPVSEAQANLIVVTDENGNTVSGEWSALYGNTEWTFAPYDAFEKATKYTLTVPANLTGDNGKAIGEEYTVSFTTKDEDRRTVECVSGALGEYYYFTIDTAVVDAERSILRFAVTNDAANMLGIYPVSSFDPSSVDTATVGAKAIAYCPIFGRGYYECDVSSYVSTLKSGDVAAFLVKAERASGSYNVFNAPLDNQLQSNATSVTYGFASDIAGIEGSGALKVTGFNTRVTSGSKESVEYFNNPTNVLTVNNVVKSENLDESDLARKFTVSFRVYDTTSRMLQISLRSATAQSKNIADYGATRYNLQTKAGEWIDVTLEFTIHEPSFGAGGNIRKALLIDAQTFGDISADYPLYIDSINTVETVTDVTVASATFVYEEQVIDHLQTEYGRIDDAYADAAKNPIAVFEKKDGEWVFKTALTSLPTKFTDYANCAFLFRADYAISGSTYDLDSVGEGNFITFDLGGNTLDITGGNRYTALTTSAKNNITFNLKNGNVYSNGMASLLCVKGGNYDKKANVNFTKLDVTLGESFGETSALVRHTQNTSATVTSVFNITFTDCNIDVSAVNSDSLTVFRAGYKSSDGYELNWTVNGGTLITGTATLPSKNILTEKGGSIVFGKGSDGKYLSIVLTSDTAISTGYTDTDGNTRYFGTVSTDGSNYTLTLVNLETPYGTIPAAYASVLKYPFFAFHNGNPVIIGSDKIHDLFTSNNLEYNLRTLDGVVIVMRGDYEVPSGKAYENLSHHQGDITIDLMGYTLDGTLANSTGIFGATGMNAFATNLTVKNGKILLSKPLFTVTGRTGVDGKVQGFTFENLEIESSGTSLIHYNTPKSATTVNIAFNDCIINSESLTQLFRAGYNSSDTYMTTNITVKGGVFTLGSFTQSGFVVNNNGGAVTFLPDANGNMTVVRVKSGTTLTGTAYKNADNEDMYLVEYNRTEEYDEYRLESLKTPYGNIPYKYSSLVDYPFQAFEDKGNGVYVHKTANADFFKNGGMEYDLRTVGKSIVLMRRDFTTSQEFNNLSNNPNEIILDLGGYTLIPGNEYGAISVFAKHNTTTTLTIKNGTVLLDECNFIVFGSSSAGAGKSFNIVIEGITFKFAEGAKADTIYGFVPDVTTNTTNYKAEFNVNLTFNGCVFDLENCDNNVVLFRTEDENGLVSSHVTVNGGKILADTAQVLVLTQTSGTKSSILFGKHEDSYTKLVIANGEAPDVQVDTKEGKASFKATETAGEYVLATCNHANTPACADKCVDCQAELTPTEEHTYDAVNPDCDGECNLCGAERTVVHNYTVIGKDASNHWNECKCGVIDEASVAPHAYDNGCDANCDCGYRRSTAHTPMPDDGDCTTDVICSVCGATVIKGKASHTGGKATCEALAKCASCGKEYGELAAHKPAEDDGDCTTAILCTVCGTVVTEGAEAHVGGTATCEALAECTVCGKQYGELAAHTPGAAATCTEDQTCTVCGTLLEEKLGHDWTPATTEDPKTCSVCGATEGDKLPTTPGNDGNEDNKDDDNVTDEAPNASEDNEEKGIGAFFKRIWTAIVEFFKGLFGKIKGFFLGE